MSSVLIIGKPNSGKSLLFNRLTGLKQKVANFPGVTVEVKTGSDGSVDYTDYPGIYSLNPLTKDEEISVAKFKEAIQKPHVSTIICTLDATRLERSLVLGLQVQKEAAKAKKPFLFALNMMDELYIHKLDLNAQDLEETLKSPVVAISAKKNIGIDQLKERLRDIAENPIKAIPNLLELNTQSEDDLLKRAKALNAQFGPKAEIILKNQSQLDRFFLSSFMGFVSFIIIMAFLFQSIFTWATPMMDFIETIISSAGVWTSSLFTNEILNAFVNDALFGGFGSFLVFVPQIFMLTFIIGLLEDSGYLARAAILCHRPLSFFGLSGKSFVPLLSGHACAIPAIMAARTIESPKRRMLTSLAVPLMACSARLPVYGLLVAALIPETTFFGGLFGLQGFAFFALYFFGIIVALIVSAVLAKTLYKTESDSPFVIELPPYRWPSWKPILQRSLEGAWSFVSKAGAVIFVVTVIVWVLGYFPNGDGQLETSWLALMGQWIEPIFRPLGLDWKFGVAILTSFLAREVFVGTLGTLFGIEGADENIADLSQHLQTTGFSLASGLALLVFFAIALQCVSTLAVLKKEAGNYKAPTIIFIGYSLLAYVLALITYNLALYF